MEQAFERLESLNIAKFEESEIEAKAVAVAVGGPKVPAKSPHSRLEKRRKQSQIIELKRAGP